MPQTVAELLAVAMTLPDADRAELAELLTATLPDEPSTLHPAWSAELHRRADEVDSGKLKCIPWEVVHAEMLAFLDEREKARG